MNKVPGVSVFTATFNRRSTIHRVYESLVQQTYRDFEWIVIDDGSEDNTGELISHYQSIANFPITYIWQENRGKHTAYNLFAAHAKAPLYCSIDSDDAVLSNCLERMLFHFDSIPSGEKARYAGIMCLAKNQHGELIGDEFFPEDMGDNIVSVLLRHKKLGDKGCLNRVDVLKEFPFPEDALNVYLPESYHIHGYSAKYKTLFVNEILIKPWTDPRADHLSHALGTEKNLKGSIYGLLAWPKYSMRYFFRRPKLFVAVTSKYIAVSLILKKSFSDQYRQIGNFWGCLLWAALLPLGLFRFLINK
jgi:glycosyltransferase involved in cell wall biosynthesis